MGGLRKRVSGLAGRAGHGLLKEEEAVVEGCLAADGMGWDRQQQPTPRLVCASIWSTTTHKTSPPSNRRKGTGDVPVWGPLPTTHRLPTATAGRQLLPMATPRGDWGQDRRGPCARLLCCVFLIVFSPSTSECFVSSLQQGATCFGARQAAGCHWETIGHGSLDRGCAGGQRWPGEGRGVHFQTMNAESSQPMQEHEGLDLDLVLGRCWVAAGLPGWGATFRGLQRPIGGEQSHAVLAGPDFLKPETRAKNPVAQGDCQRGQATGQQRPAPCPAPCTAGGAAAARLTLDTPYLMVVPLVGSVGALPSAGQGLRGRGNLQLPMGDGRCQPGLASCVRSLSTQLHKRVMV